MSWSLLLREHLRSSPREASKLQRSTLRQFIITILPSSISMFWNIILKILHDFLLLLLSNIFQIIFCLILNYCNEFKIKLSHPSSITSLLFLKFLLNCLSYSVHKLFVKLKRNKTWIINKMNCTKHWTVRTMDC